MTGVQLKPFLIIRKRTASLNHIMVPFIESTAHQQTQYVPRLYSYSGIESAVRTLGSFSGVCCAILLKNSFPVVTAISTDKL